MMLKDQRSIWTFLLSGLMMLLLAGTAFAGEADIKLPDLSTILFSWRRPERVDNSQYRTRYLPDRHDFWCYSIFTN